MTDRHLQATFSAAQKLLVYWRSPNACVFEQGVKTLAEADRIVCDSGVAQALVEEAWIKMPNWA